MTIKVFTVSEMVAAERATDAAGFSYAEMMETAGRSVADAIRERYPVTGARVLVLVGPGNNGGDGLVAGRYLAEAGADVAFYLFTARDPEQDANFAQVLEQRLPVAVAAEDQRFRVLRTRLHSTDILVDALLGTGAARPIGGELARLMHQVRAGLDERNRRASGLTTAGSIPQRDAWQRPCRVVAVDCPSGMNCDTGALDALAIPADLTVTFAGPKRGHLGFPAAGALGELVVADIHIPLDLPVVSAVPVELATAELVRSWLPERPLSGHKGTFGTAVIAAGSADYWGAPVLAGKGAYRAGVGLVALAVPQTIRPTIAAQLPEATYPAVDAFDEFDAESVPSVRASCAHAVALLVGPGLGEADAFVTDLLLDQDPAAMPWLVIDADGLNALARVPDWVDRLQTDSILTPHPGEMARLTGTDLAALREMDRTLLARERAAAWGQIVLLKGAFSVAAAPDGRCHILPFANPALAVGGSGDVLSGIIVGLLAQGLGPYEAAVAGAYVHGAAGALAAASHGRAGMLAGELADYVPEVLARLRGEPLAAG